MGVCPRLIAQVPLGLRILPDDLNFALPGAPPGQGQTNGQANAMGNFTNVTLGAL